MTTIVRAARAFPHTWTSRGRESRPRGLIEPRLAGLGRLAHCVSNDGVSVVLQQRRPVPGARGGFPTISLTVHMSSQTVRGSGRAGTAEAGPPRSGVRVEGAHRSELVVAGKR